MKESKKLSAYERIVDMAIVSGKSRDRENIRGVIVQYATGTYEYHKYHKGAGSRDNEIVTSILEFLCPIATMTKVVLTLKEFGFSTDKMPILSMYILYTQLTYDRNTTDNVYAHVGLWEVPNPSESVLMCMTADNFNYELEGVNTQHMSVITDSNCQLDSMHQWVNSKGMVMLKTNPLLSYGSYRFLDGNGSIQQYFGWTPKEDCRLVIHAVPIKDGLVEDIMTYTTLNPRHHKGAADYLFKAIPFMPLIRRVLESNRESIGKHVSIQHNKTFLNQYKALFLGKSILSDRKIIVEEATVVATIAAANTMTAPVKTQPNPTMQLKKDAEFILTRLVKRAEVVAIVGGNKDSIIGINDTLPWHIPEDLKLFKEYTRNSILIMGRVTFESLPKVLTNRMIMVITSKTNYVAPNHLSDQAYRIVSNIEEAIREACMLKLDGFYQSIIVAGGAKIYREAEPYISKIVYVENNEEIDVPCKVVKTYRPHPEEFLLERTSALITANHGELRVQLYANIRKRASK